MNVEPSHSAPVLGWNVGATTCSAVMASRAGEILERVDWPAGAERGFEPMLGDFLDHARRLSAAAEPEGIGVSVGGPMNAVTGRVLGPPNLPGWDDVDLAARLGEALGLPVRIEHDAAACLEAEWLWGGARGCTHAAYLTCGTGFGAGLLIGGRIVRGPDGQTPELGHVRLADDGPIAFDKAGSAEAFCAGSGIAKLASWRRPEHFPAPISTERLAERAAAGDALARDVLDEAARRTGQACALLADLFAPRVILLGSLARYLGPSWVQKVCDGFRAEALPDRRATPVKPAGLGERLQDLSAAAAWLFAAR